MSTIELGADRLRRLLGLLVSNVVVRAIDVSTTMVEAFDPEVMMGLSGGARLDSVATDAHQRLAPLLMELTEEN